MGIGWEGREGGGGGGGGVGGWFGSHKTLYQNFIVSPGNGRRKALLAEVTELRYEVISDDTTTISDMPNEISGGDGDVWNGEGSWARWWERLYGLAGDDGKTAGGKGSGGYGRQKYNDRGRSGRGSVFASNQTELVFIKVRFSTWYPILQDNSCIVSSILF